MLSKIWYQIFTSCFWFLHLSLKLRFFAYVLLSVPFAHLLWKSKCLLMPKILSYRNVLHLFGMLSPSQFQQCPLCWGYNPKKHQQPPKSTTILKVLFNNNRWRWCSHKSLYIYDILMLWILKNILEAQNSLSQLVWNKCLHVEICIFFCCQSNIRYVTKVGHWMMGSHFFVKFILP